MTIYDVDPTELIEEVAKELQKIELIKPPEWAVYVKTGASKERPPARADWWHIRAASVLRKVRLKGPIGVSKLRVLYGGLKNRGHQPERFKKGSGNIIRKILQQMEKAELIKKGEKEVHKGRLITPKGIKLMDNVAKKITGSKPVEKRIEEKKEEKTEDIKSKVEKLAKKTKEFAQGKTPTAEKLVEEAEEKTKEAPKEKKEEIKKEEKKPIEKKEVEKVPTATELAEKKEAKEKNG